jgi:hypothetical protein
MRIKIATIMFKKIILFLTIFSSLLSFSYKPVMAEEMCCPPDYTDSGAACIHTDLDNFCCDPTNPSNTKRKIPCSELDPLNPDKQIFPSDFHFDDSRLRELNPLYIFMVNPVLHDEGALKPAGVFNRALYFLFPLAGLILFVMLVWGGFEMLTGAAKKQNLDAGKQRVTAAITGFILLFISYWLIQIIEYITGVIILG